MVKVCLLFVGLLFWFLLVIVPCPRLCTPSCNTCRYYDCTIKEVTAHGFKVVFPAYGNVEEVPLEYLQKKVVVSQAKVSRELLRGIKARRFVLGGENGVFCARGESEAFRARGESEAFFLRVEKARLFALSAHEHDRS